MFRCGQALLPGCGGVCPLCGAVAPFTFLHLMHDCARGIGLQAHEQLLGVLGKLAAAVAPAAGGCLDSGPLRDDLVATVQMLSARL